MILVKNFTGSPLRPHSQVAKAQIQMLLTAAGFPNWDIGVCLTSNLAVRKLNAEYRGKDKATDILSFPFTKAERPGVLPAPKSEDERNLGDIYIAVPYVNRWCKENNMDINERLPVLYAHGVCHLLGYDHQDDKDYAVMKNKEIYLLSRMKEWQAIIDAQGIPPSRPGPKPSLKQ